MFFAYFICYFKNYLFTFVHQPYTISMSNNIYIVNKTVWPSYTVEYTTRWLCRTNHSIYIYLAQYIYAFGTIDTAVNNSEITYYDSSSPLYRKEVKMEA